MKKLIIFGNGKIAEAVYNSMLDDKHFNIQIECFCVERKFKKNKKFLNLPNYDFESIEKKFDPSKFCFFVAVGYQKLNELREKIIKNVKMKGYELISFIHNSHRKNQSLKVGKNCFLMQGATIHPNVTVNDNVFIWGGAIVCHHTKIRPNSWITAGSKIMGSCIIGKNNFIAGGALISHSIKLGSNCFIGANTLVNKNLSNDSVVINKPNDKFRIKSKQFIKLFNFT